MYSFLVSGIFIISFFEIFLFIFIFLVIVMIKKCLSAPVNVTCTYALTVVVAGSNLKLAPHTL